MNVWSQTRNQYLAFGIAIGAVVLAATGIHWAITVVALVLVSLAALLRPQFVVAGVVASIPLQAEVTLPFIRGEFTMTQLLLFGLVAGWSTVFWRRKIWLDSVVVGFLLVMAAYAVSFIAVDTPSLWFQETYRWAVAGIFYVICRSVISKWTDIRVVLWAMIAGVMGVSILSLYQFVFEIGPDYLTPGGPVRLVATLGTRNTLAAYLEMTVPVLLACIPLAWYVRGELRFHPVEKWLLVIGSLVGLGVLALTQSRGGLIGIAAACVILWWQLPNRMRISTATITVFLLLGSAMIGPGQAQLGRFLELREETSRDAGDPSRTSYDLGSGRGAIWGAARAMIADKPLTGIGAGEFNEHYREYVPSWYDRQPRGQAHNVWLQMGAQAGIWGILAYASWLAASVWSVVTARRRVRDKQRYWLLTGVLAVFAAYTLHSMVDYLNVLSLGLHLSVLTAIALNLAPEPLARYETEVPQVRSASSMEIATCPR